jgi:hypothetical protein
MIADPNSQNFTHPTYPFLSLPRPSHMRYLLLALAITLFASDADQQAAARLPIEAYLRGHATQNPAEMDRAFLPTARIQGVRLDGKYMDWSLEEYKRGFSGKPFPDEAQRKRTIDLIDIRGTAAIARATLDYPSAVFTDYFLLLLQNGEWRIANKVFSVRAK